MQVEIGVVGESEVWEEIGRVKLDWIDKEEGIGINQLQKGIRWID